MKKVKTYLNQPQSPVRRQSDIIASAACDYVSTLDICSACEYIY